jgi:hypothetical protein
MTTTESTATTTTPTKRFSSYPDEKLRALTNEQLNDSIRIEAIERGINSPITLPEAIRRSEWRGYQKPAEAIKVFTLKCGYHTSPFGWLDESLAHRATEGMVGVEDCSYPTQHTKIKTDAPEVVVKWVGVEKSSEKSAKFEEYVDEKVTEFNTLRDECLTKFSAVRQAAYNMEVNLTKKAEYLRLAGGDQDIARAFWGKVERAMWPE